MKKLLVVFGLVVFLGLCVGGWLVSTYNTGVNYEANINKADKASQDVLSFHFNALKEIAQVPDKYIDGMKDVYTSVMNGRYGDEGSKAVFQWIQEQNPQIDSKVYTDIQKQIIAGRKEFSLAQRRKVDICGDYEKVYKSAVTGNVLKFFNFPNESVLKKCTIVLNTDVIKSFETGVTEPIDIWGKK